MAGLQNRKQQVSSIDLFRKANEITHAVRIRAGVRWCAKDFNAKAGAILVICGLHLCIPRTILTRNEQQSSAQQREYDEGDDSACGHANLQDTCYPIGQGRPPN